MTSFEINGTTYLFVASYYDGVQVLSIDANGDMELVDAAFDNSVSQFLYGANTLVAYEQGGTVYLTVASGYDNTLTTFSVSSLDDSNDGHLTLESTKTDFGLDRPYSLDHVEISGRHFILSTSYDTDGLSVYESTGNGNLTLRDSVFDSDDEDLQLDYAYAVHVVTVGTRHFVYVSSNTNSEGFSVFELSNSGTLTSVQDIPMSYDYISDFESVTVNGTTYLFASESYNEEIITYKVAADGTVTVVNTIDLNNYDGLNYGSNPFGLTFMEIDGVSFLAASVDSDGLVLFSISDDGSLTPTESLYSSTYLDDSDYLTHVVVNGRHYIVSANTDDNALTSIEIGGGDNTVLGTSESDTLHGLRGDDDLLGYGGNDTMYGGSGNDVLSGRLGNDILFGGADDDDVLLGHKGNDTLDGGAGADVLIGGLGYDRVSYKYSGAGVTIDLSKQTASGGSATGDIISGFEQVRGSSHNDVLTGDDGNNTLDGLGGVDSLNGGLGNDVLNGGVGNDSLYGQGGNDKLNGQNGNDYLNGGYGNDTLAGGSGKDVLRGGNGNDTLYGSWGDDTLLGDAGNDTIKGGDGKDRIGGGLGNDNLTGGNGSDCFVFGNNFGSDTVKDFDAGVDKLDFSNHSKFEDASDVMGAALEISGTVYIVDGSAPIALEGVGLSDLSASDFIF